MLEYQSAETELHSPIPTSVAKARIHVFAEQISRQLAVEPGDVLESLVARLGGRVTYNGSYESIGGAPPSIVAAGLRDFTIYLPIDTSQVRDRFTIAHELGHLFLHLPMVQKRWPSGRMRATRWVDQSDSQQQRAEWEANWFAAAFLMPSEDFRDYWEQAPDLERIASKFAVSEKAAKYRAIALGLTNE